MIDSHCHLDGDRFGADLPDVLARARATGITAMICVGSGEDLTSARASVAIAARESDVYATVGVHPHDVRGMTEADWAELDGLAAHPRVVGVGETGLDYFYDRSPREVQQAAYRRFVALARAVRKPLSSHVRDAHTDAATILRETHAADVGGVIHCFTGNVDDARSYLDLGHHLSFSGILTFKTADDIRAAARFAPADRILVETDAPFLAPIPHRGKRNEPAFVAHTLETLAALRGISREEADRITSENTRRLFGLA
ncbi:MAG TPA: TatD family hydrolase [Polyangia bacterium]|nr:TatD family hydrolase [Polyangia bacterium]